MPANMPYPGESDEQFLERMMMGVDGGAPTMDPRLSAMQRMMGKQQGGPGPLTDPRQAESAQFGMYGNRARNNQPIEEIMTYDKNFGGDASMANAYGGGYDAYAGGPPPSRMQMRNRMVMNPDVPEDEIEEAHMLAMNEMQPDESPAGRGSIDPAERGETSPSTEDELDMVQKQITRSGSERDPMDDAHEYRVLGNDEEGDKEYIQGLIEDGEDPEGVEELMNEFEAKYGYRPD